MICASIHFFKANFIKLGDFKEIQDTFTPVVQLIWSQSNEGKCCILVLVQFLILQTKRRKHEDIQTDR